MATPIITPETEAETDVPRITEARITNVKGGPDMESIKANHEPSKAKTVTLTFNSDEELKAFEKFEKAAAADERTVAKYLVRYLRNAIID